MSQQVPIKNQGYIVAEFIKSSVIESAKISEGVKDPIESIDKSYRKKSCILGIEKSLTEISHFCTFPVYIKFLTFCEAEFP